MIREFWPNNILISDFWEEKLQNSGMTHFNIDKSYSTSFLQ